MAENDVRSVVTALRILDEVAGRQPVGVSDLARVLNLPKSSVQRTLQTLRSAGWIQTVGVELTRWRLTTHMLRVGQLAAGELGLRDVAVPVMEELRGQTKESVHLAVPEQDNVIVIERLDSPQAVRTFVPLGMAAPMAASANGKAILATRSPEDVRALLKRGLSTYTAATVTNERSLLAQLQEVRRLGYATNEGEWRTDVAAVASAITVDSGLAIAGISVSMPTQRLSPDVQLKYGGLVNDAAERISGMLRSGRRD
jgi:DNA-binding IclR family transcriptional regulator